MVDRPLGVGRRRRAAVLGVDDELCASEGDEATAVIAPMMSSTRHAGIGEPTSQVSANVFAPKMTLP